MMAWRERFDTTTHWAIIATTGIITFGWTNPGSGHFLFLISNVVLYLLLSIEARRYRFYDAYRARVRILEAHFIFPVVTQSPKHLEGDWRRSLGADMLIPSFKIGYMEALSRRFNRNYIWLFGVTLITWTGQTFLNGFGTFDSNALTVPAPPIGFVVFIAAFYIYLTVVAIRGFRCRRASGEFQKRPTTGANEWTL